MSQEPPAPRPGRGADPGTGATRAVSRPGLRARLLGGRSIPLPASDPGLLRLMAGLRTVGAIVLVLAVLAPFRPPLQLMVVGALAAMVATTTVSEPLPRDQAVTLALGLPTAWASVAAGTLLADHRIVADIVFVVVIFAAVYVRRFDKRGTALGLIAFQLFFVSQFVQARPEALPELIGVLAASFAASAAVRFIVVRATPQGTLERLLGAFRARLRQTVDAMVELTQQPLDSPGRERDERRLRRRVVRLHECALMIQGRLDDAAPDARAAASVQRRVAGMEIAAERLAAILLASDRPPHTPLVTNRLRQLLEVAAGADWLQRRDAVGLGIVRDRLLRYRESEGLEDVPAADRDALRAVGELVFSGLGLRVALGTADSASDDENPRTQQYREELETEELSLKAESEPGRRARRSGETTGQTRVVQAAPQGASQAKAGEVRAAAGDGDEAEGSATPGRLSRWKAGSRAGWLGGVRGRTEDRAARGADRKEDRTGEATEPDGDEAEDEPRGLERPTTRAAFQVTVGSALAITGGELLSEQRWYWAVLACWVVFINTSSTGEILVKGYRRLAGTIIGVVAGVGLTGLVAGNTVMAFVLVLICIFAMFYTAPISYVLMSFFTTAMIGMLYTILHTYSADVLVLRIEETALGAACGLIAAVFVLPVRTSERTDEQLRQVLVKMRDVMEEAVRRLSGTGTGARAADAGRAAHAGPGEPAEAELLEAALALDDALDDLRDSTQPLRHPVSPLRSRGQNARYIVGLLDSAAYHVRGMAASAEQLTGGSRITPDPRVAAAAARLSRNLGVLVAHLDDPESPSGTVESGSDVVPLSGSGADAAGPARTAVGSRVARHIQRLEEIVVGLAEPLGVRVRESGPAEPPTEDSCREDSRTEDESRTDPPRDSRDRGLKAG